VEMLMLNMLMTVFDGHELLYECECLPFLW
jgi:hypothetical protein